MRTQTELARFITDKYAPDDPIERREAIADSILRLSQDDVLQGLAQRYGCTTFAVIVNEQSECGISIRIARLTWILIRC